MISTTVVFLLAAAIVLAAAAIGASLFSIWRSRVLVLAADQRAQIGIEECSSVVEVLRKDLDSMAAQLRDLQREGCPTAITVAKPGLNLSKRSQVLRMHRNGDPPDRIASALEVPLQEVDLLIKVHRIVIKSL